jgi:hypothetical protein
MPFQKVEFEFPDPDKVKETDVNVKENGDVELVVEGRPDQTQATPEKAPAKEPEAKEDPVDIEVVDDTPPKDRNRKPSAPPDELTDDELQDYSEKVRRRLQHFSKGYHDQRRAAEQAARERAELERLTQKLLDENKTLKGTVSKNQEILLEQAKRAAATELDQAKVKYKQAYEAGDADAVVAAQEELTSAKLKVDRVSSFRLPTLQEPNNEVQTQSQEVVNTPKVDPKAAQWQKDNPWFGADDEMTSFALGYHQKLVKEGVDPTSDDYYEKINSRMRQVFPDQFGEEEPERVAEPRRRASVVAPVTRSVAPKKITLTKTQVALAKRLGVPLEEYARQVAMEMRKQNG